MEKIIEKITEKDDKKGTASRESYQSISAMASHAEALVSPPIVERA